MLASYIDLNTPMGITWVLMNFKYIYIYIYIYQPSKMYINFKTIFKTKWKAYKLCKIINPSTREGDLDLTPNITKLNDGRIVSVR
jgi:hypothetical protein